MPKRVFSIIAVLVCVVLIAPGGVRAAPPIDDGFSAARKIEARHFSVFIAPGLDDGALVQRLDIGPNHKILAGQSLSGANFSSTSLGDLLDALFIWATGVLDMQLPSYRGNIKITANEAQLKDVFQKLYGREGSSQKSFYIYELNTIYIAAEDFTKEVLGHEIDHAITSNFFVVQPPEKVAEVLSGYIEFQLRKISKQ